jgi:hypothetical protein
MKVVVVILILFLPFWSSGQEARVYRESGDVFLNHYLVLYGANNANSNPEASNEFFKFVDKLEAKQSSFKKESAFLEYLFLKTHQKFLKNYVTYVPFQQLFVNGDYNCLTGTALYALLLHHFGFDYKIIETNYHIFLIAETREGRVLFEATDPAQGFIKDFKAIESRINLYRRDEIQNTSVAHKTYYKFTFHLFNDVGLDELRGLMHYNEAIEFFNDHDFSSAIAALEKTMTLYRSQRIEEFSKVVLYSIVESNLNDHQKEEYIRRIQSLRKKSMPVDIIAATY